MRVCLCVEYNTLPSHNLQKEIQPQWIYALSKAPAEMCVCQSDQFIFMFFGTNKAHICKNNEGKKKTTK